MQERWNLNVRNPLLLLSVLASSSTRGSNVNDQGSPKAVQTRIRGLRLMPRIATTAPGLTLLSAWCEPSQLHASSIASCPHQSLQEYPPLLLVAGWKSIDLPCDVGRRCLSLINYQHLVSVASLQKLLLVKPHQPLAHTSIPHTRQSWNRTTVSC